MRKFKELTHLLGVVVREDPLDCDLSPSSAGLLLPPGVRDCLEVLKGEKELT